jgi:sugar O-acyltransferase (sialic acid O-acetyltransferase NeuD family)
VERIVRRVVLFGNGQMASMARFYLTHDSPCEVAAFTVDGDRITESTLEGLPVVPFEDVEQRYPPGSFDMVVSVSYRRLNHLRAEKVEAARAKGYRLASYVSSRAHTWPDLRHGDNCLILEGSFIQPFAEIGYDVFVGLGAIVGHNSVIGDHVFIAPGAVMLGNVRVGPYTLLGANATVRDGVTIGKECVIGAGVTIRRDVEDGAVYIGEDVEPLPKPSSELRNILTWGR